MDSNFRHRRPNRAQPTHHASRPVPHRLNLNTPRVINQNSKARQAHLTHHHQYLHHHHFHARAPQTTMLAFQHPQQHYMSSAHNAFLPPIPSPLSPRSANVGTRTLRFSMSTSNLDQENAKVNANTSASEPKCEKPVPFSKRTVKKAPSPTQDELKERRRRNFLRKVEEGREGRRFESRGEDVNAPIICHICLGSH